MTHTDSPNRLNWAILRPWLAAIYMAAALGLFAVALRIFQLSTDSSRAIFLGLSASSLLFISLMLTGALGLAGAAVLTWRGNSPSERMVSTLLKQPEWSIGLLLGLSAACWISAWTPAERFGNGYYYALRLLPLVGWLSAASGAAAIFLLAAGYDWRMSRWLEGLRKDRSGWMTAGLALIFSLGAAWLAARRITRITPEMEDFWWGAGVPLLAWQVLAAIAFGLGTAWAEKKILHRGGKKIGGRAAIDPILFASIWIVAGILWAGMPPAANFFLSPSYPPNFTYYPAADAQNYDLSSQYALIGQGLFNHGLMTTYFERPLYSALLFYLHLLAGQDFERMLMLQAGLFGVFPAIAYLLGKALHSRGAGAGLAALLTLRGMNGLALGALMNGSTQKVLLTDFPTAIGLAVLLWLAVRWVQNPRTDWRLAGWLCGSIGLWGLIRPHIVFLLPVAGLLGLGLYFRDWRRLAALLVFMAACYLAVVMPWMQWSGGSVSLIGMYSGRVQRIIGERYSLPAAPVQIPNTGASPSPAAETSSRAAAETSSRAAADFALDHFLNNLAGSALSLPSTLSNDSLITLVKESETYWKPYWNGALSSSAKVLLPVNLALVALGLGAAWRRARLAGMFPLFGMLFYYLINSFARTSGGRYLVPADWVLILYYLFGLFSLLESAGAGFNILARSGTRLQRPAPTRPQNPLWQGLAVFVILGGLGSLIPLTGSLFPPRFQQLDVAQLVLKAETGGLSQPGISPQEIRAFLQQPGAMILEGRALYPRYIGRNVNSMIPGTLFQTRSYPRMSFTLVGPAGDGTVILPAAGQWFALPHSADVIVIGCAQGGHLEAWAILLESSGEVQMRQPTAALACPLPEPICDNHGACR